MICEQLLEGGGGSGVIEGSFKGVLCVCVYVLQYYTIAVGKLNVPKIANFLEIDVFVLVACPENSLLDSRDFFKPVITPYELELACLRYVNFL